MRQISTKIALALALLGPASYANDSKTSNEGSLPFIVTATVTCEEMADAYETAVSEQRLALQAQDGVIANLREQRDLALKSSGPTLLDWALPLLIGAAGAVVLIGIRR